MALWDWCSRFAELTPNTRSTGEHRREGVFQRPLRDAIPALRLLRLRQKSPFAPHRTARFAMARRRTSNASLDSAFARGYGLIPSRAPATIILRLPRGQALGPLEAGRAFGLGNRSNAASPGART
jgi:hypothetical protein